MSRPSRSSRRGKCDAVPENRELVTPESPSLSATSEMITMPPQTAVILWNPTLAATNKCLAKSNKPRMGAKATNKRPAAWRNVLGVANWRDPVGATCLTCHEVRP
jgi:hypothetical protein